MSDVTKLALDAALFEITVSAGDDVSIAFEANADLTGAAFSFAVYAANDNDDGADGSALATLTNGSGLTLAGGSISTITVSLAASVTSGRAGQTLWAILRRTDSGHVRTYAKGPLLPV